MALPYDVARMSPRGTRVAAVAAIEAVAVALEGEDLPLKAGKNKGQIKGQTDKAGKSEVRGISKRQMEVQAKQYAGCNLMTKFAKTTASSSGGSMCLCCLFVVCCFTK